MKHNKITAIYHHVELTMEEVEELIVEHLRKTGVDLPKEGLRSFDIQGVREDVVVTWEI